MEASPQLTLMPLFLFVLVAGAAADGNAAAAAARYDPQELCGKTSNVLQCFDVLRTVPGASEAPDYRALAVLLEQYAVAITSRSNMLAAAMRASDDGKNVDPCLKSCVTGLAAVQSLLSLGSQLPEDERLWDIRTNLTSLFRGGNPPPACTGGCPHIPHTPGNAFVVEEFTYVWGLMDFMEVVLEQVYPVPVKTTKAANHVGGAGADKTTGPNY